MRPQSSMGLGETYLQAQECGQSYFFFICWSQGHAGAHVEKTRRTIIRSRFRSILAHAEQKQIKLRWTGYFAKIQKPSVVGTANGEVQTNEEVKKTFTKKISSWQLNYSKKRLLPRVDQRSKNHGCPKKGRQLYAKRTISYLLLFQGYQPVLGSNSPSTSTSQDLSSTSPAQEPQWRASSRKLVQTQEKQQTQIKRGMAVEIRMTVCEIFLNGWRSS